MRLATGSSSAGSPSVEIPVPGRRGSIAAMRSASRATRWRRKSSPARTNSHTAWASATSTATSGPMSSAPPAGGSNPRREPTPRNRGRSIQPNAEIEMQAGEGPEDHRRKGPPRLSLVRFRRPFRPLRSQKMAWSAFSSIPLTVLFPAFRSLPLTWQQASTMG